MGMGGFSGWSSERLFFNRRADGLAFLLEMTEVASD
jgi:hypothetical protein